MHTCKLGRSLSVTRRHHLCLKSRPEDLWKHCFRANCASPAQIVQCNLAQAVGETLACLLAKLPLLHSCSCLACALCSFFAQTLFAIQIWRLHASRQYHSNSLCTSACPATPHHDESQAAASPFKALNLDDRSFDKTTYNTVLDDTPARKSTSS
eukprot:1159448-Pelagomonas_calceolata.AAC.6